MEDNQQKSFKSGSESDILKGLQEILNKLTKGRFSCRERKTSGKSEINKPADIEIYFSHEPQRVAICIEVANVNTTQLVGEVARLYFDSCPLKLLILGDRHVPKSGKEQCEALLEKLYGQSNIHSTPARVVWYNDYNGLEEALNELLLL